MPFSQATVEALGWYVYLLTDPRTGTVFYVGKGSGNRAYQHGAEARDRADHPDLQKAKHERILDIEGTGQAVTVEILRHALQDETTAYLIESAAIDLFDRLHPGSLLNLVAGHHSGKHGPTDATEVEIKYPAPPLPNPGRPIVLTSLDQTWKPGMTQPDLIEYTTRWWRLDPHRRPRPQYGLGVHRQIVRTAYKITGMELRKQGDRGWKDDSPGKPRKGFTVDPAPELAHCIGTSTLGLLSANPQWSVRYLTDADFAARDAAPPSPVPLSSAMA
jgi:hypothetical protein